MIRSENARLAGFVYVDVRGGDLRSVVNDMQAAVAKQVAYALSPIDLIPDFIPVLGYLDDVILLPGLIWLAIRLLPAGVVVESRVKADAWMAEQGKKPTSKAGAVAIVFIWLLVAYFAWQWWVGRHGWKA